ncbi:extracellular solute-binding protein [Paenibacillus chungangensis]|uniref:Extracellular solute-binding protein n=1 Tax=Paenibacillus chungangensis TaxID=696535 RepID=A0ABW3HTI4_9BACL
MSVNEQNENGRKHFRKKLEHMIHTLRDDMLAGRRRPGEFLPSERELVKQFHLSNKLVRVGLEKLVEEQLLEKIPRVGNRVADPLPCLPVTLKLGYHASLQREARLLDAIEAFQQEYPHIRVHSLPIAFDRYSEYAQEYLESGMLDIISMNYNNFYDFQSRGQLDRLEPLQQLGGLYPGLNELFQADGRQYVRPLVFSPLVLCYNRDHLAEAGIAEPFRPQSWDELIAAAASLTIENVRFGFYFFLHSKNRWPVFLLQNGSGQAGGEDDISLKVERIVRALSKLREMIYAPQSFPTFLAESEADAEALFKQGKLSIIMTSYLAMNALVSEEREGRQRYAIAPLPTLSVPANILMSVGLAISRASEQKAAAGLFLDFMTSSRMQMMIRQRTTSIPVLQEAAQWQGDEEQQPVGYALFRQETPFMKAFTETGLSVDELDMIFQEARIYWSKLQSEDDMRDKLYRILDNGSTQSRGL